MAAPGAAGATAWPTGLGSRGWLLVAVTRWRATMRGTVELSEGRMRVRFAVLCLREFRRRYPLGRATILVSTLGALDEWSVSLDDYGVPTDEVARVSAREHPTILRCVSVVVNTSAHQLAHATLAGTQTLLIVDDCQSAPGLESATLLARGSAATLGLASTALGNGTVPAREVIRLLGPLVSPSPAKLARPATRGTSLDLINVQVPLPSADRARYDLLTSRAAALQTVQRPGPELRRPQRRLRLLNLRSALLRGAAIRLQVAAKIVDQHRGDRTLVLHDIASSAVALGELLRRRRHRVSVWHAGLAPTERQANLRHFRSGATDVLIVSRGVSDLTHLGRAVVGVVVTPGDRPRRAVDLLREVLRGRRDHRAALYTLFTSEGERRRLDRAAAGFPKTRVFWRTGGR
jgi:superfamily II DNA or RNA helicase